MAGRRSEPRGLARQSETTLLGDAGRFVGLFLDGQTFDQIFEADDAADFGQDRGGVGIPLGQALTALHFAAVLDADAGAVRSLVRLAVLAVDDDGHGDVAAHGHQVAVGRDDGRTGDAGVTGVGRLHEGGFRHLGRAADVEGPHRQLGARLADRLGGDDADRLADVDVGRRAPGRGRSSVAQMPASASQVRAERTLTDWTPAASTADSATSSSDRCRRGTARSSVPGSRCPRPHSDPGCADRSRPARRRLRSPARRVMPRVGPQSISVTIESWATSTRRRVR